MVNSEIKSHLRAALKQYPDFPEKGILFEDIMPIFQNPTLFQDLLDGLKQDLQEAGVKPDVIVGLDARGFLFGPTLALQLGCSFVPVRKAGKLPGEVYTATYEKEYGQDVFCLQKNAIQKGQNVVIVDDIIATGGSAACAGELVEQAGAKIARYLFLMELKFLKGRDKLNGPVFTLIEGQD